MITCSRHIVKHACWCNATKKGADDGAQFVRTEGNARGMAPSALCAVIRAASIRNDHGHPALRREIPPQFGRSFADRPSQDRRGPDADFVLHDQRGGEVRRPHLDDHGSGAFPSIIASRSRSPGSSSRAWIATSSQIACHRPSGRRDNVKRATSPKTGHWIVPAIVDGSGWSSVPINACETPSSWRNAPRATGSRTIWFARIPACRAATP